MPLTSAAASTLPASAATLYLRLRGCPVASFDLTTATVIVGSSHRDDVSKHCRTLISAGLLSLHDGRYTLTHTPIPGPDSDVVRSFALLSDHFLFAAATAKQYLTPSHASAASEFRIPGHHVAPFAQDDAEMLNWLESELPSYMAIIRHAAARSLHTVVWQLADALWPLWLRRRKTDERYEAHQWALGAARAADNQAAEARALNAVGAAAAAAGRLREALEYHRQAEQVYRELDNELGVAQAVNNFARTLARCGQSDLAGIHFNRALEIRTRLGDRRGRALTLQGLGRLSLDAGDACAARELLESAFAILVEEGDDYCAALTRAHCATATALCADQDREAALGELEEARALLALAPSPYGEAVAFELAGRVHHSLGAPAAARNCYLTALDLLTGVDEVTHARVGARLADLSAPVGDDRVPPQRVLVGSH